MLAGSAAVIITMSQTIAGMPAALICLVILLAIAVGSSKAEVVIPESNEPTGTDREILFFECKYRFCEHNKKIRYWWVYDELLKFKRKYKNLDKLSFYSKMSIITGSFRRIFNEKAILGFYVVKQLKDREVLEIGPFQSDEIPPAYIEYGQGTIGRSWQLKKGIMEQDTANLPDYVELHSLTKAELTHPIIDKATDKVVAVFMLNSRFDHHFEFMDELGIRKVMEWMTDL